jgi:cellulose synthase/poly-beta-1,6-N-acetylglucosamine synthase-like glycosyltransferase
MTLSGTLLLVAVVALAYFGLYWAGLLGFVLLHGVRRVDTPPAGEASEPQGSVLVLVPSHHEGVALIDTVRTLVAQQYGDAISVCVLVEDFRDASVAALRGVFAGRSTEDEGRIEVLVDEPLRQVRVVATGHRAKHHKLNHAIGRFSSDFVAILDADHRAQPTWIRGALRTLAREDAAAVQCRKRPLGTDRVAQVWDALLSHTVFELFNRAASARAGRVSFTGSTAVFRRDVLAGVRFADCITEDTWLTLTLTLAGARIVYDPQVGSVEETTPNLRSFVLRRRRWAAGHTHAFLAHARALLRGPVPARTRFEAFFLGQFYVVAGAVQVFFAAQGLYDFLQATPAVRGLALLVSAGLGVPLAFHLSWRRGTLRRDAVLCTLAIAPHVSMAGALFFRLFERETFYFLTSFPHQGALWAAQAVLLVGGLGAVVLAWALLRPVPARELLVFLVTLPLVVFFELLGALLGLADLVLGHREWSPIDRTHEYSSGALEPALRAQLAVTRERRRGTSYVLWGAALVLAVVGANEVFSVGPCGEERALLWTPLLSARSYAPLLTIAPHKQLAGSVVAIDVVGRVRPSAQPRTLRTFVDDVLVATTRVSGSSDPTTHHIRLRRPVGWRSHTVRMVLSGAGVQCVVDRAVATSVVDARGPRLRVNGEPFVVKGMVPTFSTPALGLSAAEGYPALARIGVNAVRLYHPPTPAILAAARASQLLVIAQPEQSSWDAVDVESASDRRAHARHWDELVETLDGFPHALLLNVGNELEIHDRRATTLAALTRLVARANASSRQVPTSYATFATFVDYRPDVLGLNMLDTGATYWTSALAALPARGRPFYASELGGFVAFYELPPTELRRFRLAAQWRALAALGASGAVFYASHDNWAQAVPPGAFNDPWSPDMADDRRGFWDERGRPKPELDTLRALLADVVLEAETPHVSDADDTLRVRVRNARPYALRGLELDAGGVRWALGDLEPEGERTWVAPLASLRRLAGYPRVELGARFHSHAGLRGQARVQLAVPDATHGPVPLGAGVRVLSRDARRLVAEPLEGGPMAVAVPTGWRSVRVNGRIEPMVAGRITVDTDGPMQPVRDLEASVDGRTFEPFGPAFAERAGLVFLRFRLPSPVAESADPGVRFLVLDGLGAAQVGVRFSDGATENLSAHPYRETLIDLGQRTGVVTVRVQRRALEYLRATLSPTGEAIRIALAAPRVFGPARLVVEEGP